MNIFRKEWQLYLRDGRAGLLLLALGGLFLAAALMTGWQQNSYRRAAEQSAAAEYARWLHQPAKFAHSAAHYGMWAFKLPSPLAAADPGITAYVGSAVWMEAHVQNEVLYRPAQDAGVSERFGTLSPTVVIGVFAPLLVLLMGFGTVAREREQGLWTLSLVQGTRVSRVLSAKVLALAGLTLLALIPGLLVIGYFMFTAAGLDADMWLRLALWVAAASIYLTTVAALVVIASARIRSSARVLGIGLAVWVLAMVLLPRFANGLAASIAPLQTQQAFARELKATLAEPNVEGTQSIQALQQRLMTDSGTTDVAKLPVNMLGVRIQVSENHGNNIFDQQWSQLFDGIDRQRQLAHWAGVLSPAVAFRALSQVLTGSDFTQHRAFVVHAEEQRRRIQRLMNAEIEAHPEPDGQRHLSDATLWHRVAAFNFQLPTVISLTHQWLLQLLLLGGWSLAAGIVIYWVARRESRSHS